MKQFYTILLLLLLSAPSIIAGPIHYSNCTSASEHLMEINPEWKSHLSQFNGSVNFYINFNSDNERVRFHFENVVSYLNQKSTAHLSSTQKQNRQKLLDELYHYGIEQAFPTNNYHSNRTPYFVDEKNTHCAVAHLLKNTLSDHIIAEIKERYNNSYINEMKSQNLNLWAKSNGLELYELALIQPGYPVQKLDWHIWKYNLGIEGRVNVLKASPDDSRLLIGGEFTSIDGITAKNIIGYDGEDWFIMDNIEGIVNDIAITEDNEIFLVGELYVENKKVNIVHWQNWDWVPMTNAMNGTIHTAQLYDKKLFIGGEFSELDTINCSNLAYYDFQTEEWSIDSSNGNIGVFSTDGIVRDMDITQLDSLIIGGSFSRTGVLSSIDTINQDSCYNLSFWNGNDWEHKYLDEKTPNIHCLGTQYGIQMGGDMNDEYSLAFQYFVDPLQDFNSIHEPSYTYTEESVIQGFLDFWAYGNIEQTFIGGNISTNLVPVGYLVNYDIGLNSTDGTITAAENFRGHKYFAGTFTQMEGIPINGLARSEGTLSTTKTPVLELEVISTFNQLNIKGNLQKDSKLSIISNNGNQVISQNLDSGYFDEQISLSHFPNGIYYLYVENPEGAFTKKIVIVN